MSDVQFSESGQPYEAEYAEMQKEMKQAVRRGNRNRKSMSPEKKRGSPEKKRGSPNTVETGQLKGIGKIHNKRRTHNWGVPFCVSRDKNADWLVLKRILKMGVSN